MMNWAKYLNKGLIKEQKSNFKQIGETNYTCRKRFIYI